MIHICRQIYIVMRSNMMDLWRWSMHWKYRLFALTDNAQSFTVSIVSRCNGVQSRTARRLSVSTTVDRAAVNVSSLSCASFVHNREIRLLQSGLSCIPLYVCIWRIPSNALVIYVANRAWTNNIRVSCYSRFLSSCFWVTIIHRPRYISFQTFLAHENTIRVEDPVLPLR